MKPFYEIVKKPLVTEKAMMDREVNGRYIFEVALTAGKPAIHLDQYRSVDIRHSPCRYPFSLFL